MLQCGSSSRSKARDGEDAQQAQQGQPEVHSSSTTALGMLRPQDQVRDIGGGETS